MCLAADVLSDRYIIINLTEIIMLKHIKLSTLCMALTGMTGVQAAPIAGTGFLLGLDVGQAEAGKYCDNVANCDSADISIRGSVGYLFNPQLGVELGYTSFGTLFDATDSSVSAKQEASAWTIGVLGTVPINDQFGLLGHVGMAIYDLTNSGTVQGVPVEEKNSTKPYLGIGLKYDLSDSFALRAEYQLYTDISGVNNVTDNVHGLYAGAVFSLGGGMY